MDDEAGGLVHDDHVLVLVQHVDRDVFGRERQRRSGVGHVDRELLADAHLVRRLDRLTVDAHAALAREALDGAPREEAVRREEAVDALAPLGDAQRDPPGH